MSDKTFRLWFAMLFVVIGVGVLLALILALLGGTVFSSALISLSIGGGILLPLIGLMVVWRDSRATRRPLSRVIAALNRTAKGDLDSPLGVDDSPEAQQLKDAFDSVRSTLKESKISRDYLDRLLTSIKLIPSISGMLMSEMTSGISPWLWSTASASLPEDA